MGSLTAMRIAQEGLGDVILIDIARGLARGKAFDLEDARAIIKYNYKIEGTDDINQAGASDIVVITAGLTRKPAMAREELLAKNAQIIKDICLNIKKLAPNCIIIVVTNPLDLMTYLALKISGFSHKKVMGMGISLDSARFANLISSELNISPAEIDACVIGSHGEGMLPLARHTKIRGASLDTFMDAQKLKAVRDRAVNRGAEIVSLLGSGSAYFAPSAAIAAMVKAIAGDEKKTIGACVYLNGEYGIKDVCIGTPCVLARQGIDRIIELELNNDERQAFIGSAESIRKNIELLKPLSTS